MGCSGSKNGPNSIERPSKMRVYGDYYNNDTRTILAILKIAKIPYDFQPVDTLMEE